MRDAYIRLTHMIFGLILYGFGIALTLNAQIGYAPWEVFHAGIAKTTGMGIGMAGIVTGVFIVLLTVLLKEKIGLGSLLNMVLVGVFLDIILALNFLPKANNFPIGTIMLVSGIFTIALATYFYIKSGFGAGPRDSLMVALTKKTGLPIGVCRAGIELTALLAGWRLGGMVGIGTVISAFMAGFCFQLTFKLLNFDATQVEHETLRQTYDTFFNRASRQEKYVD